MSNPESEPSPSPPDASAAQTTPAGDAGSVPAEVSAATQAEATEPKQVIRLDDFLKRRGLVGTGGEAKLRIQTGEVLVNGEIETRRRKQLAIGDVVEAVGEKITVMPDCFS